MVVEKIKGDQWIKDFICTLLEYSVKSSLGGRYVLPVVTHTCPDINLLLNPEFESALYAPKSLCLYPFSLKQSVDLIAHLRCERVGEAKRNIDLPRWEKVIALAGGHPSLLVGSFHLLTNPVIVEHNPTTESAVCIALVTNEKMQRFEKSIKNLTSEDAADFIKDKMSRMELALSFVDKNNPSQFENMEDLIHIDEKWFFLTKDGQRFIIAADEEEPYRHVQHKNFMTKVMFLCAVARPRYNTNKNAWFDGKIGIWPIGKWEPAKRKSKNRAKGTPVWKNQLINRDVYREYLIQKLLLAVKEKWPRNNARIRLQQDGAKSHILEDDVEFKEAVQQIGLNLTVFTQAPNSPDTNILDLGFFRAIQSANDACPDNEEELIKSVEKAYGEYPWCKLNFVWLTLQSCLNKIIEHDGGNDYKIPHMGKESLWRRGRLPEVLHVTPAANAWLNPTMDDDSDEDSDDLGDEMLFPMSTATSTVAMDGEGGENAPTDGITTTGV